jgi:hypothetical protein
MKKYTIEEIRKYISKQDSLGDVMYNLNEENIDKANKCARIVDAYDNVIIKLPEYYDNDLIKDLIITHMTNEAMEMSGYEEIQSLEELLLDMDYFLEE